MKQLVALFSFLLAFTASATTLEQNFTEAIDGTYNFKSVVCQNDFEESTDGYNAFKLKTDHPGYKNILNKLTINKGIALHETIISIGPTLCTANGSGEVLPKSFNEGDGIILGKALLSINVPKKYNKKTNLGCKCIYRGINIMGLCNKIVVPFVEQTLHEVSYKIDYTSEAKKIYFTQNLNYTNGIETKNNFKSPFRKYCAKKGSDAPPTNIFEAIN